MLEWMTAGESHGPALVATIKNLPAGVALTSEDIAQALARRRLGYGRGARQKFEADRLEIISGLRHGRTLGSPLALLIHNSEWEKWEAVMSADPVPPEALKINAGTGDEREIARNLPLTKPRPGHADLPGMLKFDHTDARNVLERSSARETAARVALGAIVQAALEQIAGIQLVTHVVAVGDVFLPEDASRPTPADTAQLDNDPIRCFDPKTSARMVAAIDAAKKAGQTLGGIVEVIATGVLPGFGTYTSPLERLDSQLAAALMSIQAIKGVEIGHGFTQARLPGGQAHDGIFLQNPTADRPSTAQPSTMGSLRRETNLAGGIEGGMSNGQDIVVRAALKPISTVPRALPTVDLATGQAAVGLHQRSDTCAAAPAAVIAQAEVALVLARTILGQIGGNSVEQCRENLAAYRRRIQERLSW